MNILLELKLWCKNPSTTKILLLAPLLLPLSTPTNFSAFWCDLKIYHRTFLPDLLFSYACACRNYSGYCSFDQFIIISTLRYSPGLFSLEVILHRLHTSTSAGACVFTGTKYWYLDLFQHWYWYWYWRVGIDQWDIGLFISKLGNWSLELKPYLLPGSGIDQ